MASVAATIRRQKVEQMLLRGYSNQDDMAAALGVTSKTICLDIRAIRENWIFEQEQEEMRAALYSQRIKQLEYLLQQAHNGWEASKATAKEVSVIQVLCPVCRGMAALDGQPECRTCHGDYTIKEITRKRKGQVGDPAFLALARDITKELSKLQALYPVARLKVQADVAVTGQVDHQHNHLHGIDFASLDPETILKLRAVMDEAKKGRPAIIEGTLVDASKATRKGDDD